MRIKKKPILILLLLLTAVCVLVFVVYHNDSGTDIIWKSRQVLRFNYLTRDPSRIITYHYPISSNYTIDRNMTIDLSEAEPDWTELDRRLVIVTGFDQHLANVGLGMIASVQAHMPLKPVIVYNLGIHPSVVRMIHRMCNVKVRRLNFEKYPKHVKRTDNNAWRVFALLDVLNEYGAFFYVDPHVRFRAPIHFLFPFLVRHQGVIVKADTNTTMLQSTHPSLYHFFNFYGDNDDDLARQFPHAPAVSHDVLLVVNSSVLHAKFWGPLVACASKLNCITPHGTVTSNAMAHVQRFDFAAVTLLMYRLFASVWYTDTSLNSMMDKIYDNVEPGNVRDYIWAHYCNPPRSDNCSALSRCQ